MSSWSDRFIEKRKRQSAFRRKLLETFRDGDPEGLDALLESPNPFGNFHFQCCVIQYDRYLHVSLVTALIMAATREKCDTPVIRSMFSKLGKHGLDCEELAMTLHSWDSWNDAKFL